MRREQWLDAVAIAERRVEQWGKLDAERSDLPTALAKLDRAAAMHDGVGAARVADAIFTALGVDVHDPASRARAAAQLRDQGITALAALDVP